MNPQPAPVPTRQSWLVIFGALAMTSVVYLVLAYFVEQSRPVRPIAPNQATMRTLLASLAIVELGISAAWLHFKTLGKMDDSGGQMMSPGEFQTQSIVAMALAEACAIYGLLLFFRGDSLKQMMPFVAGTLAVFFFFILPKGLKFWAAWENSQRPRPESPFSTP